MMRIGSLFFALAFLFLGCHSDDGTGDDLGAGEDLAASADAGPEDGGLVDLALGDTGTLEPDGGGGGVVPTGDAGTSSIACGGMPCDTATNVCCFTASSTTCEPKASCTAGVARSCDGPEDCPAGMNVCCVKALGATSCTSTCTMGVPACHTKADCPAATQANQVAACCPISGTLRTCLDLNKNMVPGTCN